MSKIVLRFVLSLCLSLSLLLTSKAQITFIPTNNDLGAQLSKIASTNLPGYIEPLTSGLGAGLNSGFYQSADLHNILGFDIGLKIGVTILKDQNKTFNFVLPNQIQYGALTLTKGLDYDDVPASPTAVGNAKGVEVKAKRGIIAGQTIFTTPDGFNFTFPGSPITGVPVGAPQASIGLPFGFEVIGRFIPVTKVGDGGKIGLTGFGLRHDIDQYFPVMPIDIAVHFMTQKLTLNDKSDNKLMSATATAFGVEVSKSLLFLSLYGGFQIEKSSFTIEPYKFNDPSTNTTVTLQGLSIDGAKKSRVHAGVRILLAVIYLHADYSFASNYPVATIGAGFTFR